MSRSQIFSPSALGCVRFASQAFASSRIICATAAPSFITTGTAAPGSRSRGAVRKKSSILRQAALGSACVLHTGEPLSGWQTFLTFSFVRSALALIQALLAGKDDFRATPKPGPETQALSYVSAMH